MNEYGDMIKYNSADVENYECEGCCRDRYSYGGCSGCPHNQTRIKEYEEKNRAVYGYGFTEW